MLISAFRVVDLVSRIGGEEFLIILPHCAAEHAANKGEQLRSMIETSSPGGLKITASIGIACLSEEHGTDFDRLYKSADAAVYHSKKKGRNKVTLVSNKKKAG
jgi:two-component system cell cycle response regulator